MTATWWTTRKLAFIGAAVDARRRGRISLARPGVSEADCERGARRGVAMHQDGVCLDVLQPDPSHRGRGAECAQGRAVPVAAGLERVGGVA